MEARLHTLIGVPRLMAPVGVGLASLGAPVHVQPRWGCIDGGRAGIDQGLFQWGGGYRGQGTVTGVPRS